MYDFGRRSANRQTFLCSVLRRVRSLAAQPRKVNRDEAKIERLGTISLRVFLFLLLNITLVHSAAACREYKKE